MSEAPDPISEVAPRPGAGVSVERARAGDVRGIKHLIDFYAGPILLRKSLANLFEDVTEFWVAREEPHPSAPSSGAIAPAIGCGALHVLWEDLGELRTIATHPRARGRGVGRAVCEELFREARRLGLTRLFVLTFEVNFFASLGFEPIGELDLSQEAYAELRSSYDAGVAEFLDLPYVKPNTLGNTRMIKHL